LLTKFGFHHFIFALLPVSLLFLDNITEIPINDIFIPLGISLIPVIILWALLTYFIGTKKSSVIISFIIILLLLLTYTRSFLIYHDIEEIRIIAKNIILMPIFSLIGIFGIIYILRKDFSSNITSIINVVSVTVVILIISQIGLFSIVNNVSLEETEKFLNIPIFQADESIQKPDVYLLLLDAYSGEITLEDDFSYDNSKFYKQLEERGFFVQQESFSNYPNTELAMPSIMNMGYIDFIQKIQGEESSDRGLTQKLWNENKVMQIFHANEYEIHSFHGRIGSSSDMVTENYCKYYLDLNPELMDSLVNFYMPLSIIRTTFLENTHYETVTCVLDTMINFEKKTDQPIYMHMHIRLPHQPLIFDSEGNKIDEPISSYRFDSELKDAYLQQLIFTNKKTIEIIDSIQQKNPDAVIILMSDHGGRFGVNWEDPSELDYFRALNNLNALYFPGKETYFPMDVSPVNLFRIFFNLYFESDYEILDERQIWYVPNQPFKHTDVTEIIKSSQFRK
jgi:hypothetical protein